MLRGNQETKRKLVHILSAFIILVHTFEKYDLHESSWFFFAGTGIVFLCVALMHHHIAKVFPYVDGVFFVIEALAYVGVAFSLYFSAIPAKCIELCIRLNKESFNLPWKFAPSVAGHLQGYAHDLHLLRKKYFLS